MRRHFSTAPSRDFICGHKIDSVSCCPSHVLFWCIVVIIYFSLFPFFLAKYVLTRLMDANFSFKFARWSTKASVILGGTFECSAYPPDTKSSRSTSVLWSTTRSTCIHIHTHVRIYIQRCTCVHACTRRKKFAVRRD